MCTCWNSADCHFVLFFFFWNYLLWGRVVHQSSLATAFLMAARTLPAPPAFSWPGCACPPFSWWTRVRACLWTLSDSRARCSWGAKPCTSRIASLVNLVRLVRRPRPAVPWFPDVLLHLVALLRPWPWGSTGPWLLLSYQGQDRKPSLFQAYSLTYFPGSC